MSAKQVVDTGLVVSGAALSVTGAVFVAPVVISAGVVAVGAAALVRYKDQQSGEQARDPSQALSGSKQRLCGQSIWNEYFSHSSTPQVVEGKDLDLRSVGEGDYSRRSTSPFFITNLTRFSTLMSVSGSPGTAITSA